MTFKSLLKSGGLAALAIALAAPTLSAEASAQDRQQRGNPAVIDQQQRIARQEQRAVRQEQRQEQRAQRQEARQQARQPHQGQAPQQQQQQAAPPQQAQARNQVPGRWRDGAGEQGRRGNDGGQRWQGQNRAEGGRPERAEGIYNPQIDRNRDRSGERVVGTNPPQPPQSGGGNWRDNRDGREQNRDWNRDGNRQGNQGGDWQNNRDGRNWNDGNRDRDGNRDGRDWNRDGRDRDYRDDNRNRDYRDRDRNGSYRDGHRDNNWRDGRRYDNRRDHRRWDRQWRNNNRYNWNSYRYSNRHIYSPGRYYAPYRNYRYNRLSIGLYLDSLFFSNRYWINDPWQYRLPAVYGDYRWVRYYDDVLLVDTYTGEVVDVIYDFFW